jgi:hypothetical protein
MNLKPFTGAVALATLIASVQAATPSTDIPAGVDAVAKAQITTSTLRAPIRYLASDELEGRGPATRGDALARLYLATQLEELGFQPGGEKGGWDRPWMWWRDRETSGHMEFHRQGR